MSFQVIGFTLGVLLLVLGLAELMPMMIDWVDGHENSDIFFLNATVCIFFGISLILMNKSFSLRMRVRDTFMITTLSWVLFAFFASIPFMMADIKASFTDAYFESMSGFTTTGSTVFSGLDNMSRGLLLWRSITQWIGGIGIVGFAIICLPALQSGGMLLFQTESSDKSEKIMSKNKDVIKALFIVYLLISFFCTLTYYALGMSFFDAVNYMMTTVATAGFAPHDKSFGFYSDPALHWAGTFFMFASGLPFILYVKLLYRGKFTFHKDEQFRNFSYLLIVVITILTLYVWKTTEHDFFMSLTYVSFNIMSAITTTGYATTDYVQWGTFPALIFLFVTYLGACAGSTAGGLKTMRWIIIYKSMIQQIRKLTYPHGRFPIRYDGRTVDEKEIMNILCFAGLYVIVNACITLAITFTGVDFMTALSGTATTMANSGNGIGPIIGPAGNFSTLPDTAKWLLSLSMLLGRLEILTVLVLFTGLYRK